MRTRFLGIGSQLFLACLLSTVALGQDQPGQGRGGFQPPDPAKVAEVNEKLLGILDEVLEPKGMDRLLGLYVQNRGAQGVLNDLVAKKINLSDDQKKSLSDELRKIAEAQGKKMQEALPENMRRGPGGGGEGGGRGGPGRGGPGGGPGGFFGGFGGFGGGFGGFMGQGAMAIALELRMEEVRKEIGLSDEGYEAIREAQRELFAGFGGGRGPGGPGGPGAGGEGGGRRGNDQGGDRPRGGDQPGGGRGAGGERPGGSGIREAMAKIAEESAKLNDEAVAKVLDDAQEKALTELKGAKFEFPENRGFGGFGGGGRGAPGGRGGAGGRPAGDNT